jgi:hypothetical protein
LKGSSRYLELHIDRHLPHTTSWKFIFDVSQ